MKFSKRHVRRSITVLALPIMLAGCAGGSGSMLSMSYSRIGAFSQYAELKDGRYTVPAIDLRVIDPQMLRQVVDYQTKEPPGTIVVDTAARHLYLVEAGGKAMRYGIGVGKAGLAFQGNATISRKGEWPHWAPTEAMMTREPKRYRKWASGMDGGLGNPLGARAMYLYQNERDTMFRIHGTTEPETIGHAVSSGCIRLMNQDVIDLYSRVKLGTHVVVIQPAVMSGVQSAAVAN
ncbi:L,D-transpeptidase [Streptomyces sp. AcH 505]|jgi:lipoprotein-anchoring transpeptidase ErfK/SrfK|uniref:L,D-transpeptidase family protein n=1 Tax=Streptomyces sp. AcH 505 TaxID=352211 RepID=UPI0005A6CEB5